MKSPAILIVTCPVNHMSASPPNHMATPRHAAGRGCGGGWELASRRQCWSPVRPDCGLGTRMGGVWAETSPLGSRPLGCIHGSARVHGEPVTLPPKQVHCPRSLGPRGADGWVRGLLTRIRAHGAETTSTPLCLGRVVGPLGTGHRPRPLRTVLLNRRNTGAEHRGLPHCSPGGSFLSCQGSVDPEN